MATNQPFTDYATKGSRRPGGLLWGWIAAGVLALLLAVSLFLWTSAAAKVKGLASLQTQLDAANASLAAAQDANQTNQDLISALQSKIADLQQTQETSAQMSKSLEDEMRDDLQSRDVTISNLQGQLTVTILDQIMFDSGEADLKPDGQAVMRKVAAFLTEHPHLKIQIIGHTDNMPIRPSARSRFASNWELSTARALAAVHFLTDQAGVDPRRLSAVGDGEFQPIADNSTPEGRARNRRIEIAILPGAFSPTNPVPETATETVPDTSTNSAPQTNQDATPTPQGPMDVTPKGGAEEPLDLKPGQ